MRWKVPEEDPRSRNVFEGPLCCFWSRSLFPCWTPLAWIVRDVCPKPLAVWEELIAACWWLQGWQHSHMSMVVKIRHYFSPTSFPVFEKRIQKAERGLNSVQWLNWSHTHRGYLLCLQWNTRALRNNNNKIIKNNNARALKNTPVKKIWT